MKNDEYEYDIFYVTDTTGLNHGTDENGKAIYRPGFKTLRKAQEYCEEHGIPVFEIREF